MNRIAPLLSPAKIVLDLEVSSKKRLFEHVSLMFENLHGLERSKVFESLFARERLASTGLGEAVAIPHGRIKGLKDALGAVVRLKTPVAFDAPDGAAVALLVFLLVPENATDSHLETLSELAELLSDPHLRAQLMSATDPTQLHQTLASWKPYNPVQP
jgi:nitrogen PTS system EIIA component